MWKLSVVYIYVCILTIVYSLPQIYNIGKKETKKCFDMTRYLEIVSRRSEEVEETIRQNNQSSIQSPSPGIVETINYESGFKRLRRQSYFDDTDHYYDDQHPPRNYRGPPFHSHHRGPPPPPHHIGPPNQRGPHPPLHHRGPPPPPHHSGPPPPPDREDHLNHDHHRGPPPPPDHKGPPHHNHHRGPKQPLPSVNNGEDIFPPPYNNQPYENKSETTTQRTKYNESIKHIDKPSTVELESEDNSNSYSSTTEEEFMLDVRFGKEEKDEKQKL